MLRRESVEFGVAAGRVAKARPERVDNGFVHVPAILRRHEASVGALDQLRNCLAV